MLQVTVNGPLADREVLDNLLGAEAFTLEVEAEAGGWAVAKLTLEDDLARAHLDYFLLLHGLSPMLPGGRIDISAQDIGGHVFTPDTWSEVWAGIWRNAAFEIAKHVGVHPVETLKPWLGMIWSRADSRRRAQAEARKSASGLAGKNVRIRSQTYGYANYFAVTDFVYEHDHFDGSHSAPLTRAVFMAADAVTVLPYDPVRDRVLLVEQMRAAPLARGDDGIWLLEPVAGRIEPGDTPEQTAHKEAMEEAHVTLSSLHKIGEYYPSTGAFAEYLYSYIGVADLPDEAATLAGVESEGEDIRGHVIDRAALMDSMRKGELTDGPLLLSLLWLDANLETLRGAG